MFGVSVCVWYALICVVSYLLLTVVRKLQDKVSVHQEHASATAEAAWKFHTDAPILGEIDRAIVEGEDAVAVAGEEKRGGLLFCGSSRRVVLHAA